MDRLERHSILRIRKIHRIQHYFGQAKRSFATGLKYWIIGLKTSDYIVLLSILTFSVATALVMLPLSNVVTHNRPAISDWNSYGVFVLWFFGQLLMLAVEIRKISRKGQNG